MTSEHPEFTYDPNARDVFDLREAKSIKIACRIIDELINQGDTMTDKPTRAELRNEIGTAIHKHGVACLTALLVEVMDAIESHEASLERAPWWEEVGSGYEFQAGEPYRYESRGVDARELAWVGGDTPNTSPERGTFFRDTRWQPPVKPLRVGDLIETVEQAASLPVGTITVTEGNTAFRKVGVNEWRQVTNLRTVPLADIHVADDGDRIIYLPSGDSDD